MKKILVAVDLNDDSMKLIKRSLKKRNWSDVEEVHLVHGFQLQVYADNFLFAAYPMEDQYDQVKKSVSGLFGELVSGAFKDGNKPKVIKECLITTGPTQAIVDYATENSIDEMIIGTRGKHGFEGLFSSSFAEHMVRHAPCDLFICRAKE
ncbi:MAG: nucleotide-binding universal stress UspA family protein [Bacteriovoracaceae bacterium]|jgi:nucleotide-binding universal stress UspA family protein